jgi:hypothetical protein
MTSSTGKKTTLATAGVRNAIEQNGNTNNNEDTTIMNLQGKLAISSIFMYY